MGAKLVAQWIAIKEMAQKRVDLYKKLQDMMLRNNPEDSPLTNEMIEKDHKERIDFSIKAVAGVDMMMALAERIPEDGNGVHLYMAQRTEETREALLKNVSELETMYDLLSMVTGESEIPTDVDLSNKIGLMFDN